MIPLINHDNGDVLMSLWYLMGIYMYIYIVVLVYIYYNITHQNVTMGIVTSNSNI